MRLFLRHFFLFFGTAFMVAPLAMVIAAATRQDGFRSEHLLSVELNFFRNLMQLEERLLLSAGPDLLTIIQTSLQVSACISVLTVGVAFWASYALIYHRLPRIFFWITVATLTFPIEARMIPTFEITHSIGLFDSVLGASLPVLPLALGTLLFYQHFKTIPKELIDAARLDGASSLRIAWDIVWPLSRAPAATVALVAFLTGWNQYLWVLFVLADNEKMTVVQALGLVGAPSGAGAALALLAILPPLILILGFGRLLQGAIPSRG